MCANLFYNQAVMKATGVDVNGQVTDLIHGQHANSVAGQEPAPVRVVGIYREFSSDFEANQIPGDLNLALTSMMMVPSMFSPWSSGPLPQKASDEDSWMRVSSPVSNNLLRREEFCVNFAVRAF